MRFLKSLLGWARGNRTSSTGPHRGSHTFKPVARPAVDGPAKYAIRIVPKETGSAAGEPESLFTENNSTWVTESIAESQKKCKVMRDGWGTECDYIVTTYPNGPDIVGDCVHCGAKILRGAPLPRAAQRDSLDPAIVGRPCDGCGRVCCIPCYKKADGKCPGCGNEITFWYGKRSATWYNR